MPYLIYTNEEDANARADEEGKELNFDYWREDNGVGTRWLTAPAPTAEGEWALDVTDYDLDEQEQATTVPSYDPVPTPPDEA